MHLSKRLLLPFIIGFTLLTVIWSSQSAAESSSSPLPAFDVPTLSSKKHLTNKTLIGQVSLLNVWASWCGYCKREHAMLMKIKNNYHVPIYGLDFKDDPADARASLESLGNPYVLTGIDSEGDVGNSLELYGTPQTYVIDKKGMIRYRHIGGIDETAWKSTLWPLVYKLMKEN